MDKNEVCNAGRDKREWVRPELHRLEAGAAESNFSGIPDNSNPQAS